MIKEWSRRRAALRVQAGDGRPLKSFRWWQTLSRSLFHLRLEAEDGRPVSYTVDVPHWQQHTSDDGRGMAHLYLDGRHHARSKLPAAFPVPGGMIEVAATNFGLKRCHYLAADGAEHQLIPDRSSAEGRRARLDRDHPTLSRWVGVVALILLVIPLTLLIPQLIEVIARLPPITERIGTFTSPIQLPAWLNIMLTIGAAVASTERALRLRYNWLLDSVGQG